MRGQAPAGSDRISTDMLSRLRRDGYPSRRQAAAVSAELLKARNQFMKRKQIPSANKADLGGIKSDIEKLAVATAQEFSNTNKSIDTLEKKMKERFLHVSEEFAHVYEESVSVRKEIQEGFKAILAAVESVEYVKLRMRIDTLEDDVAKIKEKVHIC